MFCFDWLKYRVLTALQRHLCFIDITSYSVSICKAPHFISLRIVILKSQIGTPILFERSNSLASVSILPVFFKAHLSFSLVFSFFRVNVSKSNKISEYSSSEM